ncbi:hypothetical protein [Limnobacter alexandrii]|uniref:hypothetical protein n=1 Tax=Limnobacter alexandrii TaxID=2570352 RepID=UPI001108B209|nr:hypothetical protein [Limnobacter alexandrii]
MFEVSRVDTGRLIVAQDKTIRQALNFGHGPEYLLRYYQALTDEHRLEFVAALAAMVSLEHQRNKVKPIAGES